MNQVLMLLLLPKSVLSALCVCHVHIRASHLLISGLLFLVTEEGRRRYRQSYRCLERFTGNRPTYNPKPTSQSGCCSYRLCSCYQGSQGYIQLGRTSPHHSDLISLQSPHATGRRRRTSNTLVMSLWMRSLTLPARCAQNLSPRTLPEMSRRSWELPRVLAVPSMVSHHTTLSMGLIQARSRFRMNKRLYLYIRFHRSHHLHPRLVLICFDQPPSIGTLTGGSFTGTVQLRASIREVCDIG